jgi:tetratricopeptide (TPR) repeat protein
LKSRTAGASPPEAESFRADAVARLARPAPRAARSRLLVRLFHRAAACCEGLLARDAGLALAWASAAASVVETADAELEVPEAVRYRSRRLLAKALHQAGRWSEALGVVDELLLGVRSGARVPDPARREERVRREADLHGVRAALLARVGRPRESAEEARLARRAYVTLGDRVAAAQVDVNEANVLHRQDRHRQALAVYRRAHRALARAGRETALAACELGLGNVLSYLGRADDARRAYVAAEERLLRAGAEHLRLVVAYNRHYLEFLVGRPQAALDGLRAVRAAFESLGDGRAVTSCDLDLAEVFLHLSALPEAEAAARAALAAAGPLGMTTEAARARLHLARALALQPGRTDEAQACLDEARRALALEGNDVGVGTAFLWSGELELGRGHALEAVAHARRASSHLLRHGVRARAAAALTLEARATLAAETDDAAPSQRARRLARRRAHEALALCRATGWTAVDALSLRARLLSAEGDQAGARRDAERAMRAVEALASGVQADHVRAGFLGDRADVFRDAARYWLEGVRPSLRRAWAAAERSRCFALRQGRAQGLATTRRALRELSRWIDLRHAGAAERRQPGHRRSEPAADSVLGPPEADRVSRLVEARPLRVVQEQLADGELLVELLTWPPAEAGPGGARATALLLTRHRLRAVHLPARGLPEAVSRIAATADRLMLVAAIDPVAAHRVHACLEEDLRAAAAELLVPLERELAAATRLLVVPHGDLFGMPFHALPDPATGRALGLEREIVVLPAATWLLRRPRRRPASTPLVAIGQSDEAAPLIEEEVRRVAATAPGGLALAGADATTDRLAAAVLGARVLHVAGHGVFRADAPAQSAIRLADRWLTVSELERLPLRAELLVVSACEAGAMRAHGGGQFAGVVRALLRAGARAVVASPWSLEDGLAVDMLPELHALVQAGRPVATALRAVSGRAGGGVRGWSGKAFMVVGSPWMGAAGRPGREGS